ncbi:hypothetical protein [Aeromonas media]|uniref:hypothetical protein n=1 Tax=Aeromonas TaxID=642 RepID=UPI0013A6E657|nr:hypothetical protein [Aeromonas media]
MNGESVTAKVKRLVPLRQRSVKRKLINEPVDNTLDSDVIRRDLASENARQATERKRVSKSRVVASGFKQMNLGFDSETMNLLHRLYSDAELKYTTRNSEVCFKMADLSMMISYLISTNCNATIAGPTFGYKVYLHKIMSVVKFRREFKAESKREICDFLNLNKFKRYSSALRFKKGYDSTWEPKHLAVYITANSADEVYKSINNRRVRSKLKVTS